MAGDKGISLGDITSDSRLIFQESFNHIGFADMIALRDEPIYTEDKISAIRATDVSGQNGMAVIVAISKSYVQLAFSSDGIGKGFNFKVEIYSNNNNNNDDESEDETSKTFWNCWNCCKSN